MNWLHYLAEATLYLAIFYLAYCLLFSRETHYQLNRFYLLFSCVAAFALPVLQVGVLKPSAKPVDMADAYALLADRIQETPLQLQVQTVLQSKQENLAASQTKSKPEIKQSATSTVVPIAKPQLNLADYLWYTYLLGAAVMLILLLIRLTSLFLLARRASSIKYGKYKLVQLPGTNVAFSFFGYLFLGDNAPATDTIVTHELVHIRQKHSADIIFLELLKIINWFNPFIYLLQNSLKAVHEYIADQAASHQTDALTYATFLVDTAHGVGGSTITHSFFNYNLLKKRIIMLNQKRSGTSARLKYLITAPICAGLLCASTLAFSKTYGFIDLDPAKIMVSKTNSLIDHKPKKVSTGQIKTNAAIKHAAVNDLTITNKTNTPKPVKLAFAKPENLKTDAPDSIKQADLQKFYNDLKWYIQFPQSQRDKNIQGRVVARFCVDDKGDLQYLSIYKAPSALLGYQVSWAIQHSAYLKPLKGNWAIAVNFDMGNSAPLTSPIAQIEPDTTTYRYDGSKEPGFKEGDIYVKWSHKGLLQRIYDPQNMGGPYKTPVKVLSELVVKAPENSK